MQRRKGSRQRFLWEAVEAQRGEQTPRDARKESLQGECLKMQGGQRHQCQEPGQQGARGRPLLWSKPGPALQPA